MSKYEEKLEAQNEQLREQLVELEVANESLVDENKNLKLDNNVLEFRIHKFYKSANPTALAKRDIIIIILSFLLFAAGSLNFVKRPLISEITSNPLPQYKQHIKLVEERNKNE